MPDVAHNIPARTLESAGLTTSERHTADSERESPLAPPTA